MPNFLLLNKKQQASLNSEIIPYHDILVTKSHRFRNIIRISKIHVYFFRFTQLTFLNSCQKPNTFHYKLLLNYVISSSQTIQTQFIEQ